MGGGGGNPPGGPVTPTKKGKNAKNKKQNKAMKNVLYARRGEHMFGWDEAKISPFQTASADGSAILGSDNSQISGLQGVVVGGQANCVGPSCSTAALSKRMLQQGGRKSKD